MIWFVLSFLCVGTAHAARIKDIASVYGARDNMIFGYGLVTGLRRTGDTIRNEATLRSLAKRLQGLGLTLTPDQIRSRNVAAVMVTSTIPSSARPGQRFDVLVSSAGDASSLSGGVLQLTPLQGADGNSYAIAQGPLVIGGISAEQNFNVAQKNSPNTGRVPLGALIEQENPNRLKFTNTAQLDFLLNKSDFTTAQRMATAINTIMKEEMAIAVDSTAVAVRIPESYKEDVISLLAIIENVDIKVDLVAKVVVNERTGTVVMGGDVTIAPVAVAHGGLSVQVKTTNEVIQPNPLTIAQPVVVQNTEVVIEEEDGKLTMIGGVTVGEMVRALNDLGVKPRELIQILLAIKESGALQAELEVL
jgi:flagellar P-ring protein precursor FlgI